MVAFPEDYSTLVPKLLIETIAVVGASFVSRINLATGDVVPETKALAKGCVDFCCGSSLEMIAFPSVLVYFIAQWHNSIYGYIIAPC